MANITSGSTWPGHEMQHYRPLSISVPIELIQITFSFTLFKTNSYIYHVDGQDFWQTTTWDEIQLNQYLRKWCSIDLFLMDWPHFWQVLCQTKLLAIYEHTWPLVNDHILILTFESAKFLQTYWKLNCSLPCSFSTFPQIYHITNRMKIFLKYFLICDKFKHFCGD